MKKFGILALLLAVSMMIGCGGSHPKSQGIPTPKTEPKVEEKAGDKAADAKADEAAKEAPAADEKKE